MTKNIMLAASMTMLLVAIPGQAFARAAATTEPHRHEVIAPSGRQAADTFNAFDATMATPSTTHRYEGGPKTND